MTVSACRSTRRGWRRAASFGRHRPMASLAFRPRSSPICSTESIGAIRAIRSGRSVPDRCGRIIFQESAGRFRDSIRLVMTPPDLYTDDIETLRTALVAAHAARLEAEAELAIARARASGAEALVEQLRLPIAKYKRDKVGPSSQRAPPLGQLELHLEEFETTAA